MDLANFNKQRSAPLWALTLSAALVAINLRRHDEAGSSPEREHGGAGKTEADAPERGWSVHWTGAAHRLARDLSGSFGSKKYAQEELVAEIGAAFLCAALGIAPTVRHADYIGANQSECLVGE